MSQLEINEEELKNLSLNVLGLFIPLETLYQKKFIYQFLTSEQKEFIDTNDHLINLYYGLYFFSTDPDTSFIKAIYYFQKSMENGNIDAIYYLGKICMINKKYDEMKIFFEDAINKGNVKAMNDYAYYHQYVVHDYDLTKKYYMMAIAKDHAQSMHNLGSHYYEMNDVENAIKYLEMASLKDHFPANNNLGTIYSYLKDTEKTQMYYLKAMMEGNIGALYNLCDYFDSMKMYDKKLTLLNNLIENSDALVILGNHYKDIEADEVKMKNYYDKAIELENPEGAYQLSHYYATDNSKRLSYMMLYAKMANSKMKKY
ncbi:MAG: hypothetical protein Edafosvirus2_76 [Edafosvirus sp.]|uniref:Uncharacterized protein n=1 Tax=Edafosvirus sp. TaxID=2487765 RepID=A0A3G4ZSM9_9VIRU|nr:MAG: hypothetical protein Edafosvirus2_76 [Edafosvirus sp.]